MNKTLNLLLIILFSLIALTSRALATESPIDLRFIWEPLASQDDGDPFRQFAKYILTEVPNGVCVTVIDGSSGETVAKIDIPELRYDGIEARLERIGSQLATVRKWCKKPRDSKGIRLPEVLHNIADDFSPSTRLIIWGNPYYSHVDEALSFRTQIPDESVFELEAAEHPFGLVGRKALQSASFLWIIPKGTFTDEREKLEITGFYNQYLQKLHASGLYAFTIDRENVFQKALAELKEPIIIRAPRPIQAVETSDQEHQLSAPQVSRIRRDFEVATEGFPEAIGIAWLSSETDFDVWSFDENGIAVGFKNKVGPHTRYLVDRTSGDGSWETIVYTKTDVPQEIWINCYATSETELEAFQGIYFLRFGERIVEREFKFYRLPKGEGLKTMDQRFDNPDWIKLDWANTELASH
jgi:hypothetical protein